MVFISENKLPGIYAIETSAEGERSFCYWRNDSAAKYWLRDLEIAPLVKALSQHQMIYLSGISLAILPESCRQRLFSIHALCRENGAKISFDNNYRPALWKNSEDAQHCYQQMLSITDLAFLTFDDEKMLYGDENEQQSINRAQQLGVQEIVIKRGGDDCFVVSTGSFESIAPLRIKNITDTTAAGDSFSAGYLAKRLTGGDMRTSAIAGHTLAGCVIQHRGAIIANDAMPII